VIRTGPIWPSSLRRAAADVSTKERRALRGVVAMVERQLDPPRLVAALRASDVRHVLAEAPGSQDRVAVFIASDDPNVARLRRCLDALEAGQPEPSTDPHRAVIVTSAGRLECIELSEDDFVAVEADAVEVDLGHGVVTRAIPSPPTPATSPRSVQDLLGAVRASAFGAGLPDAAEGDEFGPDPSEEHPRRLRRVVRALEDVDRFLVDLTEGRGRRGGG
jgi:hypothetical protein